MRATEGQIFTTLVALVVFLVSSSQTDAQCEGGTRASNGRIPALTVGETIGGRQSTVTFSGLPRSASDVFIAFSFQRGDIDLSARYGSGALLLPFLRADAEADPPFEGLVRISAQSPTTWLTRRVPARWSGRSIYVQAFVRDSGGATGGFALTGGVEVFVRRSPDEDPASDCTVAGLCSLPNAPSYPYAVRSSTDGKTWVFGDSVSYLERVGESVEIHGVPDSIRPKREASPAVFDPDRGCVILFGGFNPETGERFDDIYEFWPGAAEEQRFRLTGDRLPRPQSSGTAFWDVRRRRAVILGGIEAGGVSSRRIFEYTPSAPSPSRLHMTTDLLPQASASLRSAFDDGSGIAILAGFGSNEVLSYDAGRPEGSRIRVHATLPRHVLACAVVAERSSGRVLIVGGDYGPTMSADVYSVTPSDAPGSDAQRVGELPLFLSHSAAIDADEIGSVWIIGGLDETSWRDSIMTVDLNGRSFLWGAAESSLASSDAFAVGSNGRVFILADRFLELSAGSGSDGECSVDATSDGPPEPTVGSVVAFDASRGKAYVFGGIHQTTGQSTDRILEFDPNAPEGDRVKALPDRLPEPQSMGSAVWDPIESVVYVFGGVTASGHSSRRILRFDPDGSVGSRVSTEVDSLINASGSISAAWDDRTSRAYLAGDSTSWVYSFDPRKPSGSRFAIESQLPLAVSGAVIVPESRLGAIVIAGGVRSGTFQSAVYQLVPRRDGGSIVAPVAELPRGRSAGSGVFLRESNRILLIGGNNSSGDIRVLTLYP